MTPRPPKKTTEPAAAPTASPKRGKKAFLIVAGSFIALLAACTVYSFAYANRIPPRTVIAGVPVGGLTREQAVVKVNAAVAAFAAKPLTLTYSGRSWDVKPADLGSDIKGEEAVNQVWQRDKTGSWKHQTAQVFRSLFENRSFGASFTALSTAGQEYFNKNVLQAIETPFQETSLDLTPGHVQVVPGKAGAQLLTDQFANDLYQRFTSGGSSIELQLETVQPKVTEQGAEQARMWASGLLANAWTAPLGNNKNVTVPAQTVASWLTTTVTADGAEPQLALALKEDVVKKVITDWASQALQSPTNAKVKMVNGVLTVTDDAKDGITLDPDATFGKVQETLLVTGVPANRTFTTVLTTTQAEIRRDTIDSLGLKELIGTATTDFTGSPSGRVTNIGVGQRALNGIIVNPGDTFSTIGHLVPIDASNGYVPELVIKNNRTVPEDGGGLCQVSTTLFRSVLNAGLPIVERQNHAYRVSYYERGTGPGLDATIYDPSPDFKWKNDTGHAILVQSFITGKTITFELYGTSDGRSSTISAPRILETYPVGPPIYSDTDTLPAGTIKQIEHPHDGAKTEVDYTVMRDGQKIYGRTFTSVYKAWPAQFLRGTGTVTAPPPTATPSPSPTPTP